MFERRPIGGTGAASFELAHRLRRAEFVRPTTEPHDFALQALGETGIVGFALFGAAVVLAAVAVRRRLGDAAAVALAVCLLAYLGNILIDIGWDYVAVSAPAFLSLGVLLAEPGTTAARREPIWALGALALGVDGVLLVRCAGGRPAQGGRGGRGRESGARGAGALVESRSPSTRCSRRRRSRSFDGRPLKALRLYRAGDRHAAGESRRRGPSAASSSSTLSATRARAYRSLSRAYELDRYNRAVAFDGGPLDVARARARKRGCA